MEDGRLLVSVVDDDESVRESLPALLYELGFVAHVFSTAADFLASKSFAITKCLLLDLTMRGMSGEELQAELHARQTSIPIIFITAHQDEAIRSRVTANGASGCLFKPFSDLDLLDAVNRALGVGH